MRQSAFLFFFLLLSPAILQAQDTTCLQIHDLGNRVNTDYENYFPYISIDGNTLLFTVKGITRADYSHESENIYWSKKKNGVWQEAEPITLLNDRYDEGSATLSSDGKYLFYVVSNRKDNIGGSDIYYTYEQNGQWQAPRNMGTTINTKYWESTPCVSRDLKTLYFSSNRPNGFGKMDIWQATLIKHPDGSLTCQPATNMGPIINSPYNELSPYAHPDGHTLYYSSNRPGGNGGYDIYKTQKDSTGHFLSPQQLDSTINTPQDEIGFVVDAKGTTAYFASNRKENQRRLYSMTLPASEQASSVYYIKGKTYDLETHKPLEAQISIQEINGEKIELTTSISSTGDYFLSLPSDREVILTVNRKSYLYMSTHLQFSSQSENGIYKDVYLQPIKPGLKLVLRDVNFDNNDYHLLQESFVELSHVISMLQENPDLKIELGGHTDSVGNDKDNQQLSEKRARAVQEYLINKGIAPERIQAKGYGKSQPLTTNETEAGRATNRRTEIKIL